MPRSGTTIFLKTLYETEIFASPTYQDLPFVLSPKIWSKLKLVNKLNFIKKKNKKFERFHNDGINIDQNSPDAFEEIFWKIILEEKYIKEKCIVKHTLSKKNILEFKYYISIIKEYTSKDYYISKNNNNIFRIESLHKYFPSENFIIMFRHPYHQSMSLMKMDNKFSNISTFDKYYLNFVGHYEFGDNYKSFYEKEKKIKNRNFEFWLDVWIKVYSELMSIDLEKNVSFLSYEILTDEVKNKKIINRIVNKNYIEKFKFENLRNKNNEEDFKNFYSHIQKTNYSEKFNIALKIYNKLLDRQNVC